MSGVVPSIINIQIRWKKSINSSERFKTLLSSLAFQSLLFSRPFCTSIHILIYRICLVKFLSCFGSNWSRVLARFSYKRLADWSRELWRVVGSERFIEYCHGMTRPLGEWLSIGSESSFWITISYRNVIEKKRTHNRLNDEFTLLCLRAWLSMIGSRPQKRTS